MLDFMDHIQLAFAEATNWNLDNSYSRLTATAQCTLHSSSFPWRLMTSNHIRYSTPRFLNTATITGTPRLTLDAPFRNKLYPRHGGSD